MRKLLILMVMLVCQWLNPLKAAGEGQARAMWVVRYTLASAESIDKMIRRADEAGFDNLFVQVCGRGDAWFPSNVYPYAGPVLEQLASGFDPLAYVLEKAHGRGIKVHAWINTLLVWSAPSPADDKAHVSNSHKDWMMSDRDGNSMAYYSRAKFAKLNIAGMFMSPANPAVRSYIENFVRDLASRYPVDGIHLDYVRYPMSSVDYSPDARRGFHATEGTDPLKLVREADNVRKKLGRQRYEQLALQWKAVRAGYVSGLVARIKTVVDSVRPEALLSAAVKPDIASALSVYGQDWPRWLREGYVQMVLPMAYGTDAGKVYGQIEAACDQVGRDKIWAGIRAWDVPVSSIVDRARRLEPLGTGGICFFSYDGMQNNRYFFDAVRNMFDKR
jgi:uncharacterized lipoprotein YddW (UPF0748 family)